MFYGFSLLCRLGNRKQNRWSVKFYDFSILAMMKGNRVFQNRQQCERLRQSVSSEGRGVIRRDCAFIAILLKLIPQHNTFSTFFDNAMQNKPKEFVTTKLF
jgi:hypothetical protein